jgi:hypothetical protein
MSPSPTTTATCACGRVTVKGSGKPIASAACFCNDCRAGAARIETLPNAPAVRDADGGTSYILFRKDRFECTEGADLLRSSKLKETSPTNRVVASCCNSAMFMNFDRGPHWVSVYRARCHGDLPPLDARIFTKFRPEGVVLPNDVPNSKIFPLGIIVKLLASRVAMALGR